MNPTTKIVLLAVAGAALFFGGIFATSGLTNVDAGERAVVFNSSGQMRVLQPGKFQWIAPAFNSITKYDVRSQLDKATASAASRDLQEVNVEVAVQFHPDPSQMAWIHQNLGGDYLGKVIQPAVQEAVKASTAQHEAANIVQNRPLIKQQIEQVLSDRLTASHIILDQVSLTNIGFSAQYTEAIEASQTARQTIILETNKLQVARLQANQTIVAAQAQAESARLLANSTSGNQGQGYLLLQWLARWDGHLPQFLGSGGDTSFILPSPKGGG